MNNKNFIDALNKTLKFEGGFTDGKNQICDAPTNMGITQTTLNKYNAQNPSKNFPKNVRDLTRENAITIYHDMYWARTRIGDIENARIRNAAFDMNVMSGIARATRTIQRAMTRYGVTVTIDGIMGAQTIRALNNIPTNKIDDFMDVLKTVRMESLQRMINWATSKNGWRRRTMSY